MIDHQGLRQRNPVTAVIPAYNEEKHIGQLLNVLFKVSALTQVIVVDDASTDNTHNLVHKHSCLDDRVQLVCLPVNQGKGGAMVIGAQASNNELIVFLDADLIELRPKHVLSLIKPVRIGAYSMSIGIFTDGRRQTDISAHF